MLASKTTTERRQVSKWTIAAAAAIALVFGGVVPTITAAPVVAHTADITADSECVGDVRVPELTLTPANVPSGVTVESVKYHVGTQQFQPNWNKDSWTDWTPASTSVENGKLVWTVSPSIPGTTTGNGPWYYVITKFSNGHTVKSDTRVEDLKGDCNPPFDHDWEYPAPTCDAVTITFPANLPAGQQGVMEVNVTGGSIAGMQYKLEGDAYKAKYPNGHAGLTVVIPWTEFRNYSIPSSGVWTVTGLQVHGTNYHWAGELECGEEPPPPPPPVVVTPAVTFTPPTCTAAGDVVGIEDARYTWERSGPESARNIIFTPVGNVTLTQTSLGPYDLRQLAPTNTECPPIVVPANPHVEISSFCVAEGGSYAEVVLSNPYTPGVNTIGTPVTFTIKVTNGDKVDSRNVTVQPGSDVITIPFSFPEDTGKHLIEVFDGDLPLDSKVAESDCLDIEVTPVAPTFKQPTCEAPGKLTVPTQPEGVKVVVDGLKVTFSPKPDYFFPENTKTEHTFVEVKPTGCDKPTPPPGGTKLPNTGSELPLGGLVAGGLALLLIGAGLATAMRLRRS